MLGRRALGVGRRGKYLLIALDGGLELIVHLGMTGACLTGPGERPHLRWRLRLDDGSTLDFDDPRRFGRAWVRPAGQWRGIKTLERMGAEPVAGPPAPGLLEALRRKAMIKPLLLSQQAVAGVGNIYADEALWLARVHPRQRGLGSRKAALLAAAIVAVLTGAVERGGTTLRNYRDSDGRAGGYQAALNVYGREGEPCPRCGAAIRKVRLGGRGTHFCPKCQRRYPASFRSRKSVPRRDAAASPDRLSAGRRRPRAR